MVTPLDAALELALLLTKIFVGGCGVGVGLGMVSIWKGTRRGNNRHS